MLWSIPAYSMLLYHSSKRSDDIEPFDGPDVPFYGGVVVAGWLMISLWLTNGKTGASSKSTGDCETYRDPIVSKGDPWLTPNRWFCVTLVVAVVMMIFMINHFAPALSVTVAGVILWATLGAIAPALQRQLTGRPIRHRPDLSIPDASPTSSLGVRGLMVLTFCIAAAIGAARKMSGGDLVPLYPPAAMGILGGLVWVSMVLSMIGRKRRYLPVAIGLTVVEAVAAGQWILFSPAADIIPVESVILFIVSTRVAGWVYLSVMRASGYRIRT
jgi:hypothetical protein